MGRRWKRQTGRETEKRRGRDIVPLFGNEIPGTLADEPCVTPTAKSSQKPPGKIGDSPLGTLISEEGGSGGNSCFLRSLATGRCNKEGVHGITEPLNKAEWLEALSTTVSLVDLGIKLAWGYQAGYLALSSNRARPTRTAGLSRGGLFPLPVSFPETLKWGCAGFEPCALMEQAVSCWAALGCAALNAHYGLPEEGKRRRPGKVHISALENMRGVIKRFLLGEEKIDFSFADVVSDLKGKKVSYSGEEIQQPQPLTCEQIVKGLPPKGHGGCIPILQFLSGRTKHYMQYPLESLLAEKDRGSAPCSAKVHIAKGSELSVFSLLKERGIISWLRDDQVFSDSRGKYLSGMFGVSKPGKFTENNLPVLRVIMNLIPVNALFGVLRGDIDCLPNATCWIPLVLSEGDEITMSQGDMSSAFYLFEIPTAWQPFMCFNFVFKGEELPSEGLEKGAL